MTTIPVTPALARALLDLRTTREVYAQSLTEDNHVAFVADGLEVARLAEIAAAALTDAQLTAIVLAEHPGTSPGLRRDFTEDDHAE